MKKQTEALAVQSPLEVQQEQFAALVVFGDGNGKGFTVAQASKAMGINVQTGRHWWRTKVVQDYVREQLDTLRNEAKLKTAKHVDQAINTLVAATNSPVYTTPQVNAAKALLSFAFGEKQSAEASVALQVNVATGLPEGLLRQQQRRHSKQASTEAEFKVLDPEA